MTELADGICLMGDMLRLAAYSFAVQLQLTCRE